MGRITHRGGSLICCLTEAEEAAPIAGARDSAPVRGLTHDFYKYPARFSPAFVRVAVLNLASAWGLGHVDGYRLH
jgi:hypothetical protein